MSTKVLIISKVRTHPVKMGNNKAILAQAEMLKDLDCVVDYLYVQEMGLHGDVKENEVSYQQTKDYWGDHFLFLKVSKFEKLCKNIIAKYRKVFCGRHEGIYDPYPWQLTQYVKQLQKERGYDICLVQYYYLTKLFKKVRFNKMACFTHDAMAYKNLLVNENCPWINADQEARALQQCTDIFAIQEEEKDYFHILSPKSRVYNIYTPYSYKSTPYVGNKTLLFLSGNNGFNQNGLQWFIEIVFPLIREKFSDAQLLIAGGICNVIKGKYDHISGIRLMGYVKDPMDLYELGDVAINPVYQGTGLKIKTFESISFDKVTLVHPHSVAGIYKKETAPLFVSDKPEEWVAYLERIWSDKATIMKVKEENQKYIESMNEYIETEYKRFLSIVQ